MIEKIKEVKILQKNEEIIGNSIEINFKYNLKVAFLRGEIILGVVGEGGEIFRTSRVENTNIAGWVAQGDYSFGDYSHHDHWGVAVDPSLKRTALADFLYNLKSFVDDQLEFEHVSGKDLAFLTFYIKKGYLPESVITTPDMEEYKLSEEEKKEIFNHLINQRKGKNDSVLKIKGSTNYAFKLKLDPKNAVRIYNQIKGLVEF